MARADSRIRSVHILVRKLKLSSTSATTRGRTACSISANASVPGASMASKSATPCPRSRSTAAVMSVASGGYGFIFSTCLGSSSR